MTDIAQCDCIYKTHCVPRAPGCRIKAGATVNEGGGVCGPPTGPRRQATCPCCCRNDAEPGSLTCAHCSTAAAEIESAFLRGREQGFQEGVREQIERAAGRES